MVGAQQEMEKIDQDLAKNPLIFPTDADLQKVQVFTQAGPGRGDEVHPAFQKALGA